MKALVVVSLVSAAAGCLAGATFFSTPAAPPPERPVPSPVRPAPRNETADLRREMQEILSEIRSLRRAQEIAEPPQSREPPASPAMTHEPPAAPAEAVVAADGSQPRPTSEAEHDPERDGWAGDLRPVSWSRLDAMRAWGSDPTLRRSWLLKPPRAVQEWFGMPDRISVDPQGREIWGYDDASAGGEQGRHRFTFVFFRRRLIDVYQ